MVRATCEQREVAHDPGIDLRDAVRVLDEGVAGPLDHWPELAPAGAVMVQQRGQVDVQGQVVQAPTCSLESACDNRRRVDLESLGQLSQAGQGQLTDAVLIRPLLRINRAIADSIETRSNSNSSLKLALGIIEQPLSRYNEPFNISFLDLA